MVSNSNSISIISIINRVVFEFEDYSDKTPSIIPRKSDKIGESRKGVAVYFPPGAYIPLVVVLMGGMTEGSCLLRLTYYQHIP